MPRHDYRCPRCGRVETQRVEDDHTCLCITDPYLEGKWGTAMEKLPSAPNFVVRGGTPTFHKGKS